MDLNAPISLEKSDLSTDLEQVSITISNLAKMKRMRARFDDTQVVAKLAGLRDQMLVDMEETFHQSGMQRLYSSKINDFMGDYHLWKETLVDDEFLKSHNWNETLFNNVINEVKMGASYLFQKYSPRQLQTMTTVLVEYRINETIRILKERCKALSFSEFTEKLGGEFKLKQGEEIVAGLSQQEHKKIVDLLINVHRYSSLYSSSQERKNIRVSDIPNYLRIPAGYTSTEDEQELSALRDEKLRGLTKTLESCGMREIAMFKLNEVLYDYHTFIENPSPFDNVITHDEYKECVEISKLSEEELFKYSPRSLTVLVSVMSKYRMAAHANEMASRKKKAKDFKKYTNIITNEFRRPGYDPTIGSISQSQHSFMEEKLKTIHKYRCLAE